MEVLYYIYLGSVICCLLGTLIEFFIADTTEINGSDYFSKILFSFVPALNSLILTLAVPTLFILGFLRLKNQHTKGTDTQ